MKIDKMTGNEAGTSGKKTTPRDLLRGLKSIAIKYLQ